MDVVRSSTGAFVLLLATGLSAPCLGWFAYRFSLQPGVVISYNRLLLGVGGLFLLAYLTVGCVFFGLAQHDPTWTGHLWR